MADPIARHLVLIGLRASGKSTVGRRLAAEFGVPFADLDDRTAALLGAASVGDAFRSVGERRFRDAESEALRTALAEAPQIIALGGGTPTAPGAAAALAAARDAGRAVIVFLDPATDTLAARLAHDAGDRPSLTGRGVVEEIEEIARMRRPLYAALADFVFTGEVDSVMIRGAVFGSGR
ncbi:MAG: shikimate kinase II [Phycisphaera sp.]|nr:shikimate kinase II [Phycisphaera sp.]